MKCTDFTGTSLMQANFGPQQKIEAGTNCRTNFSHAVLDVNAIDTEHWGKTDFTWTDFQNLSTATFNLAGARLAGANFSAPSASGTTAGSRPGQHYPDPDDYDLRRRAFTASSSAFHTTTGIASLL
jgi:uncharacterized protein YjbI with pentapeptide repeats